MSASKLERRSTPYTPVPMATDDLIARRKLAEGYFRRRWPRDSAYIEDFGSYCLELWYKNQRLNTGFGRLGIVFLRTFVRKTGKKGSCDAMASRHRVYDDPTNGYELQLGKESEAITSFDLTTCLRRDDIPVRDRICMILYFERNFNNRELGDLFGVSEGRMSQMMKEIIGDQRKRLAGEKIEDKQVIFKKKVVLKDNKSSRRKDTSSQFLAIDC